MIYEIPQAKVFLVHEIFAHIGDIWSDDDTFDEQINYLKAIDINELMDEDDIRSVSFHLGNIVKDPIANSVVKSRAWRTLMALPVTSTQIDCHIWSLSQEGAINSEIVNENYVLNLRTKFLHLIDHTDNLTEVYELMKYDTQLEKLLQQSDNAELVRIFRRGALKDKESYGSIGASKNKPTITEMILEKQFVLISLLSTPKVIPNNKTKGARENTGYGNYYVPN